MPHLTRRTAWRPKSATKKMHSSSLRRYKTLVLRLWAEHADEWSTGILPVWQTGRLAWLRILIGKQDARRPHSQDGCAPQDSDAGQHQQLPKRQAEQQEGKNHKGDACGFETKPLSNGGN
jgi:hypothetical protein